jgi:hypothetical protein
MRRGNDDPAPHPRSTTYPRLDARGCPRNGYHLATGPSFALHIAALHCRGLEVPPLHLNSQSLRRIVIASTIAVSGLCILMGVLLVGVTIYARQAAQRTDAQSALAVPAHAAGASSARPSASTAATLTNPGGASLGAYEGLGSWVDIYDDSAWRDPSATVDDMARHGVRTLFIQTAHYNSSYQMYEPAKQVQFISAAHARGMKVVAWYLPSMKPGSVDYPRIMRAIRFRTPDGQAFDGFALDIESDYVKSEWARNRGLEALSRNVRATVGPTYALGAIIPSPVGLTRPHGFWTDFPYTMLASIYDVFVPMGYYTYHGHSPSAALSDVRANIRIIRAQPGCSTIPVHLIGGIAEKSSAAQAAAFVQGARAGHVIGASLYGWAGTSAAEWRILQGIQR